MKNLFKRFTAVIAAVFIFCLSVVPSSVSASYDPNSPFSITFCNSSAESFYYSHFGSIDNYDILLSNIDQYGYDVSSYRPFLYYFLPNVNKFWLFFISSNSVSISEFYDSSARGSCRFSAPLLGFRFFSSDLSVDSCTNFEALELFEYGYSFYVSDFTFLDPSSYSPLPYPDYSVRPLNIDILDFALYLQSEPQKDRIYHKYSKGPCAFLYRGIGSYNTDFPLLRYYDTYGRSLSSFICYSDQIYDSDFLPPSLALDKPLEYNNRCSYVFNMLNELYSDYQKSKLMLLPDREPNISTDDSLVTDVVDDTTDVSLLREIIRILSNIYNSIVNGFFEVNTNLVNVINAFGGLSYGELNVNFDTLITNLDNNFKSFDDNQKDIITRLDDLITLNGSGSGSYPYDLEELLIIDFDSPVYDEYMALIQDKFYNDEWDELPYIEDFIPIEDSSETYSGLVAATSDNMIDDLYQNKGQFKAPVVKLSIPTFTSSGISLDDTSEVTYIDFSTKRWVVARNLIKGIVGCFVLVFFCKWIVKFIPAVLSGYSNGGE